MNYDVEGLGTATRAPCVRFRARSKTKYAYGHMVRLTPGGGNGITGNKSAREHLFEALAWIVQSFGW